MRNFFNLKLNRLLYRICDRFFHRHAARNFRVYSARLNFPLRKWDILAIVVFALTLSAYVVTGHQGLSFSGFRDISATVTGASVTENAANVEENISGTEVDDAAGGAGRILVLDSTGGDVRILYSEISDEYMKEISEYNVLVLRDAGGVEEVPVEQYVAGVVASEMPSSFEPEALKAQAVAARTYVTSRRDAYASGVGKHEEAYVCDTTCCQVYRDVSGLRLVKSEEWLESDFNKIKSAVVQTAGQLLYYDGELVTQPLFFSCSGGRTENSEDVFSSALPYLKSVSSDYENAEKYDNQEYQFTYAQLEQLVSEYQKSKNLITTLEFSSVADVEILSRTDGDGVAAMRIGNLQLTGRQARELLNLPSADFTIKKDTENVTFITQGNGHRVGLSQYGANGMAENGYTYKDILTHYYSGTTVT